MLGAFHKLCHFLCDSLDLPLPNDIWAAPLSWCYYIPCAITWSTCWQWIKTISLSRQNMTRNTCYSLKEGLIFIMFKQVPSNIRFIVLIWYLLLGVVAFWCCMLMYFGARRCRASWGCNESSCGSVSCLFVVFWTTREMRVQPTRCIPTNFKLCQKGPTTGAVKCLCSKCCPWAICSTRPACKHKVTKETSRAVTVNVELRRWCACWC